MIHYRIESDHFISRHNISGRNLGEASTIETNFQTLFVPNLNKFKKLFVNQFVSFAMFAKNCSKHK